MEILTEANKQTIRRVADEHTAIDPDYSIVELTTACQQLWRTGGMSEALIEAGGEFLESYLCGDAATKR